MKILVVVATNFEILPLIGSEIKPFKPKRIQLFDNHRTDFIVSGVGSVPTSYCLSKYGNNYDLLINLGIAGSYSNKLNIGDVVMVREDTFGDLGIDNLGEFIPFYKTRMIFEENNPLVRKYMLNPWANKFKKLNIPSVKGVTLNTTSGSSERISQVKKIWNPDIETMESAAVFYYSLITNKPFICIRSISNIVEPRNEKNWQIRKAIINLCDYSKIYISQLPTL